MSSAEVLRVSSPMAPITAWVLRSSTLIAAPMPAPTVAAFTTAPATLTMTVLSFAVTRTSVLSTAADVMMAPLPIWAVVTLVMSSTFAVPDTPQVAALAPAKPNARLSIEVSALTSRPPTSLSLPVVGSFTTS